MCSSSFVVADRWNLCAARRIERVDRSRERAARSDAETATLEAQIRIITNGDEAAVILHYSHGIWSIYKP
jgi:hypothetical protein